MSCARAITGECLPKMIQKFWFLMSAGTYLRTLNICSVEMLVSRLDVFTKADLLEDLQQQVSLQRTRRAPDFEDPQLNASLSSASAETASTLNDGQQGSSEAPPLQQSSQEDAVSVASIRSAGSESHEAQSMGISHNPKQQQQPSEVEGIPTESSQGQRPKFKWGDRADTDTEKALEVAFALPYALWVSSLTESGLDDLKESVLQLLAE